MSLPPITSPKPATSPSPLFSPDALNAWATWPAQKASDQLTSLLTLAVERGRLPGAVVWAEDLTRQRSQQWVVGQRAQSPEPEAMTLDTRFDVASLTKGVVTATLMAQLLDEGRLSPDQAVSDLWPVGAVSGMQSSAPADPLQGVTLRHLLTHSSGLDACLPLTPAWSGLATAQALARASEPTQTPGTLFRYSDINFILLQGLMERLTGLSLDQLACQRLLEPCGMANSAFRPLAQGWQTQSIAPTERDENGPWLRGVVHDPVCRRMGGVGGHAGLFSTASDLARFARMLLRGGLDDAGHRVMSESAVRGMTAVASLPGLPQRSLGWDIDSPYARARGRVHGPHSFGHTAFTGCALWMDPQAQCFTLLLSNRVHTAPTQSIVDLYEAAATLAAQAVRG